MKATGRLNSRIPVYYAVGTAKYETGLYLTSFPGSPAPQRKHAIVNWRREGFPQANTNQL